MTEYAFRGTSNEFIFIVYGSQYCCGDTKLLENILFLIQKYKMSVEDINKIPHCVAKYFPKVEGEYSFIVNIPHELTDKDKEAWQNIFTGIDREPKEDGYLAVICSFGTDLERVKTKLLPFI